MPAAQRARTAPSAHAGWPLFLALAAQIPLAAFLGHAYDMPIFMASGYLVAGGHNPYIPLDLSEVFKSALFRAMTSIGYPPPWALVAGIAYRLSYALVPSIPLYNLALKLPIIAANAGLAYLVGKLALSAGATETKARGATIFMLFNPFVLLTTSAWGQFDSIVSLLSLLSLYLLYEKKLVASAVVLALAVSLKPIALPLIPVCALAVAKIPPASGTDAAKGSWMRAAFYLIVLTAGMGVLCVLPFIVFDWDPTVLFKNWNAHFSVAGGLSWMTFYEIIANTYLLPVNLRFLGLLWAPALAAGIFFMRPWKGDLEGLMENGLTIALIFFLSRTWLSEPNVNLILPMAVVLAAAGKMGKTRAHAMWILPLLFSLFNTSLTQLFPFVLPRITAATASMGTVARTAMIVARTIVAGAWIVLGVRIIAAGLKRQAPDRAAHAAGDRSLGDPRDLERLDAREITIELGSGITLLLVQREENRRNYPTAGIQKGLILRMRGEDLSEEGVGIGVPVLKRRFETVFAGSARVLSQEGDLSGVSVEYDMNLVERLEWEKRKTVLNGILNGFKEAAASIHRRFPFLRKALTGFSNTARKAFDIKTVFVSARSAGKIRITYTADKGRGEIGVSVDAGAAAKDDVKLILMNEQGANQFDRYVDSDGLDLGGEEIETWHEVTAAWASFIDSRHGVEFTVTKTEGAELFRGRELVPGRLAWAGFAYILPPGADRLSYVVSIGAGKWHRSS